MKGENMENIRSALESELMWIPTAARLPKDGEMVLVTVCGGDAGNTIDIGEYERGYGWRLSFFDDNEIVTAWQPSPNPYEPYCWNCEYGGDDEMLDPGMFGLKCHHEGGADVSIILTQGTPHNCPLRSNWMDLDARR